MTMIVALIFYICFSPLVWAQESQDPTLLNGGSVLAMAGDGCVALAVDRRFGSGPQVVNVSPRLVLAPHPRLLVAFTGLEGDVQSLADELSVQLSAKAGRSSGFGFGRSHSAGGRGVNGRVIAPSCMAALTSNIMYRRRRSPYYVEPIICGLERVAMGEKIEDQSMENSEGDDDAAQKSTGVTTRTGHISDSDRKDAGMTKRRRSNRVQFLPFLCAQDVIGAQSRSDSFVCAGAASKSMFGIAEAMWRPRLKPEELVRVCGRAFLSAMERDCLSGYGAVVYLISRDGIVEYELACRND